MAEPLIDRTLRRLSALDRPAAIVQRGTRGFFRGLGHPGSLLKSALHGARPLGHPLHPALSDIPVGAWSVALVADMARALGVSLPNSVTELALLVGAVGAVGAAVTGYTDFSETAAGLQRRGAFVHGLLMTLALVLMAGAGLVGHLGSFAVSFALLVAGYLLMTVAASMGGHLVFHRGTQVNRNAFAYGPEKEYVSVGAPAEFPEGEMVQVKAGPMFVLTVRVNGVLHAIDNACAHAGGPLHRGTREGYRVTCPWHGSQFDNRTGGVIAGPATSPQPCLLVHETAEDVSVKLERSLR